MSGGTTRAAIWREGIPGDIFPTLDHSPRYILMGGGHPGESHDLIISPINPLKGSYITCLSNLLLHLKGDYVAYLTNLLIYLKGGHMICLYSPSIYLIKIPCALGPANKMLII